MVNQEKEWEKKELEKEEWEKDLDIELETKKKKAKRRSRKLKHADVSSAISDAKKAVQEALEEKNEGENNKKPTN